jgi:hypothetical protein
MPDQLISKHSRRAVLGCDRYDYGYRIKGRRSVPEAPVGQVEPKEAMRADCSRCSALCCVAPSFRMSAEFAADKAAGVPCPHLVRERSCGMHDRLRTSGYRGCAAFDCFGAGQHVTQVTFAGYRWQDDPAGAAQVFVVFDVMRRLKEMLWHLADAASAVGKGRLRDEVHEMRVVLEELSWQNAGELENLDVPALQGQVMRLLGRSSQAVREEVADRSGLELATADLSGANLAGTNLRGADLRYARLSNAVLSGADLFGADMFGADVRDADVRGARLGASLFLTQMQLEVTTGDGTTTIPSALRPPDHWRLRGNV